ncbi:hypothetical protein LCGC14_2289600, partial [marine sediment metagenome]
MVSICIPDLHITTIHGVPQAFLYLFLQFFMQQQGKEALEEHLRRTEGQLFALEEKIILY